LKNLVPLYSTLQHMYASWFCYGNSHERLKETYILCVKTIAIITQEKESLTN